MPDAVPPPLPRRRPATVPYFDPADAELPRWSAARVLPAAVWTVIAMIALHVGLAVITPKCEAIFTDFRLEVTGVTKMVITASRAYRHDYVWLATTAMLLAMPLLWLGIATPRRRERLFPAIAALLVGALVLWMLVGLLLPMGQVYQAIGSGK